MVGVAGKSKGCTTCRRRKIRCGQERPHCANCIQTGRLCEGYDRFPVFINRTLQGLQKRKPLEEAKSDSASRAVALIRTSVDRLPSAPSAGKVWSDNFLSWFWDNYSPMDGSSNTLVTGPVWLYHAMTVSFPTEALTQALLALSIVRRGRINNDNTLLYEGRNIYSQALRLLQKDLYDLQRVGQEETLAATRVMALYEVFPSVSFSLLREAYLTRC